LLLDPKELGRDLVIVDGDLSPYGNDLDLLEGPDHVVLRFARELMSPHNLLARYTFDSEGLKALDEDYGNEGFYELSEPLDQAWIERVKAAIYTVGENQPNLIIDSVNYQILDLASQKFGFDITVNVQGSKLTRLYVETSALGFNVRVA
jgi:hypothetical protein